MARIVLGRDAVAVIFLFLKTSTAMDCPTGPQGSTSITIFVRCWMDLKMGSTISNILDVIEEIRSLTIMNQQLLKELEAVEAERQREREALLRLVRELETRLAYRPDAA